MIEHSMNYSIPFFDVDSMNIVWHGNYVKYLELARCELLDKIGYNYKAMKASNYMFPIVDMNIKYVKPLLFEQKINITAQLVEWDYCIKIVYKIRDAYTQEVLTKATTTQATISSLSQKMQLNTPECFTEKVNALLSESL